MSPSSRPVSKAAEKRVTRSQSKCRSILISDKRNREEAVYSEESVDSEAAYSEDSEDSESTEECNWREQCNSRRQKWIARFQELKLFKAKHGHCNVHRSTGKLGRWVTYQRNQYRQLQVGKQSNMTDERIQKLESIGFQWSLRVSNEDLWEIMFDDLKSYKAKHGHCNVKNRSGNLGTWVDIQRAQYRQLQEGNKSSMIDERVQKLESIDFQWSSQRSENKSAVHAAEFAGGATDIEPVSTSTPDGAHHRGTEASSNDHITNVDCQLNDDRDVSCDEPDAVISSRAASKVDSEFRPFLLGCGYC